MVNSNKKIGIIVRDEHSKIHRFQKWRVEKDLRLYIQAQITQI